MLSVVLVEFVFLLNNKLLDECLVSRSYPLPGLLFGGVERRIPQVVQAMLLVMLLVMAQVMVQVRIL